MKIVWNPVSLLGNLAIINHRPGQC